MFTSTFGYLLRKFRKSAGWTQAELARKTCLTSDRISHLESDRRPPTDKERVALTRILGMELYSAPGLPNSFEGELKRSGLNLFPKRRSYFPPQDRANSVRYWEARNRYPNLVRRATEIIYQRLDFKIVQHFSHRIANGSYLECLFLLHLLVQGARPTLVVPALLGYLPLEMVDPIDKTFVGNRPFAALSLDDNIYFFQVSFQESQVRSVDVLVWAEGWSTIEIDGEGHDDYGDQRKTRTLKLPVVRLSKEAVVRGLESQVAEHAKAA